MTENENNILLQPEVWNKILLKLWENEEDLETLLTCRLVCTSWKKLIDKMPPKPHWNPWHWLRDDIRARDIFEKVPATSFKTDEDITQFSAFVAELWQNSPDEVKKNPFCNKTVKLFDQQYRMSSDGMEKLYKLLEEHGHHIHQLYYSPPASPNKNMLPFPLLLPTVTNLRSLAVNFLTTTEEERRAIIGEDFPKDLEKLQELVIIVKREPAQFDEWDDINSIYEKFFISYGSQIKSLTLDEWSPDARTIDTTNIYEKFPNLEEFKVENLLVALYKTFKNTC